MQRRQARQRRDYLYRRALTLRDAETAAKRAALRSSLASGKQLDPTIANDASLRSDYKYDESIAQRSTADELALDDEYALLSGVADPRVLVTTARDPSAALRAFAKEVRLLLPTGVAPNRGGLVLAELVRAAQASAFSDVVMLHEHRGTPTALTVSHLPHGPTARFSLHNVVGRAAVDPSRAPVNESYPRLVFEGFTTPLGKRVVSVLKHLFPPLDATARARPARQGRVVTFRNDGDAIEVRHHAFVRAGRGEAALQETGPRFTMRLFEIRAGTLADSEGEKEWRLSQYTRTARKKDYL